MEDEFGSEVQPEEGDWVRVVSSQGEFLALGQYQIGSIAVRIFSFDEDEFDDEFFLRRLQSAYELRQTLGLIRDDNNAYRLVHGEGDGLPGLIIDVYAHTAVMQAHTAGIHYIREALAEDLIRVAGAEIRSVYYKSETTLGYKTEARQEAEAAISNKYGLMASADDDAALHQSSTLTFRHPLWEIGQSFHDERMSATMECYLKGYNDPRIKAYFLPTEANGDYKGARNGMNRPNKDNYKDVTSAPNFSQGSDMQWMHAAEAYFLLAEAQLRWGLGEMTARQCYEAGITASFASAGASNAGSYYTDATSLPQTSFQDAYRKTSTDVSGMLSNLTIAWDENASDNEKMERIMIQKWLALYPDGQEAWSEMRRTGYPGWVRIQSMQTSEVSQNEMISRLKFPTTEYSNNSDNTKAAVTLLGGEDKAGTRLWWDVKR